MADLSEIQAAQTVKITGASTAGSESNYVNADANGNMLVKLANGAGSETGVAATPLRIDPTGTTPQPASQSGTWSVRVTDGTDTQAVTANSEAKVVDGLRNGGVYGAITIPTVNVPAEAKVGAARLTNRKFLLIRINDNGLFWGLDSSVTVTSGLPTVDGQILTFAIDPDSSFQIWLVGSGNNKHVHVVEAP